MDWNSLGDEDFRNEVKRFIDSEFPRRLTNHPRRIPRWDDTREWYLKLSEKGWIAPNWPREYGGMGLSPGKLIIYMQEMEQRGVPRIYDMGIFMLGPILIWHGTEAQRAAYLPKILSGEHRWAQGYSEPNAGSDLASLRTRAEETTDGFLINGSKIWVTFLEGATHIFVLARTKDTGKKQEGISFFLMDLDSVGIRRRLIKNLSGYEEFGEVFFDNVHVSHENLVGSLHGGWRIAKELLGFERINIASPRHSLYALGRLANFVHATGLNQDSWNLEKITQLRLDLEDQISAYSSFCARVSAGKLPGQEISFLKIWSTETFQKISNLLLEISSEQGLKVAREKTDEAIGSLRLFYHSRPSTIYGGSNEIQKNIIARSILGLP